MVSHTVMNDKKVALLELLDKCCFDFSLLVDAPIEIEEFLSIRSDKVHSLKSENIDTHKFKNKKFDLILSFSNERRVLDMISKVYNEDNCEMLIVYRKNLTFSLKKILKLYIEKSSLFSLKNIDRLFLDLVIQKYYAFPNINDPEMILTKDGFRSGYFRYWSWKVFHIKTLANLIEMLFVRYLNSAILSQNLIIKINTVKNA